MGIKFTFEASLSKVNFLDITVHIEPSGDLWTDPYCKPTDSHSYFRLIQVILAIAVKVYDESVLMIQTLKDMHST